MIFTVICDPFPADHPEIQIWMALQEEATLIDAVRKKSNLLCWMLAIFFKDSVF
jgi:hypothetical protein